MAFEGLINLMHREIQRSHSLHSKSVVAIVTGWNPDNHTAKVQLKPGTSDLPNGAETGWLPVAVDGMGDGHGDALALRIGDQVEVSFQEGDPDTPRITGRFHSDVQKPPRLEEGEMVRRHQSGAELRQDKNGNIWIKQGGSTVKIDSAGVITSSEVGGASITMSGGKITLNAPSGYVFTGNATWAGNITQTGVHTDSNGVHH